MCQEIIIKNEVKRNLNEIISRVKYQENELFSIDKITFDKLKFFLQSKTIYLKMVKDKLVIENIILDGKIKIKDTSNRISRNINNRFNVAKSYVATTRKGIVSKCKDFYSNIRQVVNENKLIVDISHEVNLQRELYRTIRSDVKNGIAIVNKKLNFNPDFCQKTNESLSSVITVQKSVIETLKNGFRRITSKFNNSFETKEKLQAEIRKVDYPKVKQKVKAKSPGYAAMISITVVVLIGVFVLSYSIVNMLIK